MTPLKKYIRPGVLRGFLRKACEMAGEGCPFAILYEDEVVLVEGAEFSDGFGQSDPGVLCTPLQFAPTHSGVLCLRVGHAISAEEEEWYKRLLEFTAFSVQEHIDLERARRSIADEALTKYRELALLHRSVPIINTSMSMRDVVGALITECQRENYPGELGMIFLSEPGSTSFRLALNYGFSYGKNPQPLGESELFLQVAQSGKAEIVNNLAKDERWEGEIPGLGSMALIPIVSPNRTEGMLVLASENTGLFEAAHRQSLATLASVAGISVSNAFNFEGIQTLMNSILQALAEAIDSRDPFTAGHSERVAHLAVAFAQALSDDNDFKDIRFDDEQLREIFYAGILHDVGKIGIKEDVLTKKTRLPKRRMDVLRARLQLLGQMTDFDWDDAYDVIQGVNEAMTPSQESLDYIRELGEQRWEVGKDTYPLLYEDELEVLLLNYGNLTQDERNEIQRHPAESERILQHIPLQDGYADLLNIIRQHHERMDGSGYPDGLKSGDILLQSRLMAIVDIYDAITQERHYKPAFTKREAMSIISKESESGKLDSRLADFFLKNSEKIELLSTRVKSTRVTHLSEIGHIPGM